jgi:hypothetical protein
MAIVAHIYPFVISVDTHARNHALSLLVCPHGEITDEAQLPATPAGLTRAVSWVSPRTSLGRPSNRADSDRKYTLNSEEPDISESAEHQPW